MLISVLMLATSFLFNLGGRCGAFTGTDPAGHAFLPVRLVDCGPVPLYACFLSDPAFASNQIPASVLGPGTGWSVPFLECRVVPAPSDPAERFVFFQPDGTPRTFSATAEKDTFTSGHFWTATRKTSTLVLRAHRSGYPEAEARFDKNGRMTHYNSGEGRFAFSYDAQGFPQKVTENGMKVLEILRKGAEVTFKTPKTQMKVLSDARGPCLFDYGGTNQVHLTWDLSSDDTAGFHTTDTNVFALSWSLTNGVIRTCNTNRFTVAGTYVSGQSEPEFTRHYPDGTSDWFRAVPTRGLREWRLRDGSRGSIERGTNGVLKGKLRSRMNQEAGGPEMRTEYDYSRKGNLKRIRYLKDGTEYQTEKIKEKGGRK